MGTTRRNLTSDFIQAQRGKGPAQCHTAGQDRARPGAQSSSPLSPVLLLLLTVKVPVTLPQAGWTQRFLALPLFIAPEAPVAGPALEKATLFDSQDFSILLVKYKMAQTLVIGLEKQKDQPTPSKFPPILSLSMSCLGELIKSVEGGLAAPS